jgi:hypothetical protein
LAHVPGLHYGLFSRPGRVSFEIRRRSWVLFLMLFAVLLRFACECVFPRLAPTCRFAFCPPRDFDRGEGSEGQLAAASGVWPRERAVPCDPSVPQELLCTGPKSDSPAWTALSFGPFSGLFSGLLRHFWRLSAHGLFACCRDEPAGFRPDIARALGACCGAGDLLILRCFRWTCDPV